MSFAKYFTPSELSTLAIIFVLRTSNGLPANDPIPPAMPPAKNFPAIEISLSAP